MGVRYNLKSWGNNIERDKLYNKNLKYLGWAVLRVWESDIYVDLEKSIQNIVYFLK